MRNRFYNSLLRLIIIVVAGFVMWKFSDAFLLALDTLVNPREALLFDVLSALAEGVLGPALPWLRLGCPLLTNTFHLQRPVSALRSWFMLRQ